MSCTCHWEHTWLRHDCHLDTSWWNSQADGCWDGASIGWKNNQSIPQQNDFCQWKWGDSSELGRWTAATVASVASGVLTVIMVLPLSFPTALDPSFVSPPSPPVTLSPYSLTAVLTKHFPPSGCFCANYTDAATCIENTSWAPLECSTWKHSHYTWRYISFQNSGCWDRF